MRRRFLKRLAMAGAACVVLGGVTAPAPAQSLEDLGIDLGSILGRRGGGSFGLVERILESELPKRVGPARKYEVRLDRKGMDLARGRLGKVDVTGLDVQTDDGLVIPQLGLQMEDVKLALASRSLESVAKSLFSASLGEEAVTRYVQKRAGVGVRDVRVAFRDSQLHVKATPELLGFGLPSEVSGKPVLNGEDAIDFRASRVSVLGIRVPRLAVDELERKINPVVDLSGLKLPVRITDLRVQGSRLVADGSASFGRR